MGEIMFYVVPLIFLTSGIVTIYLVWRQRRTHLFWAVAGVLLPVIVPIILAFSKRQGTIDEEKRSRSFLWAGFTVTILCMLGMLILASTTGTVPVPKHTGPIYETTITKYRYGPVISSRTRLVSSGNPMGFVGLAQLQALIFAGWALLLTFWKKSKVKAYRVAYTLFLLLAWLPCYYVACFLDFPWFTLVLFAVILFGSFYAVFRIVTSLLGFD